MVVSAPDEESVLQRAQGVAQQLDGLVAAGVIAGYESPTQYLPSRLTQAARRASLPDAPTLRARLATASSSLPLRAGALDDFVNQVAAARSAPDLTRADFEHTSMGLALDALLWQQPDQWYALLPLRAPDAEGAAGDIDIARVRAALATNPPGSVLDVGSGAGAASLPLLARGLQLPTGVAGAWIGTSEFADAAGLAAAQAYGGYAGHVAGISGTPEAAVNAFTLMKVIGRDVWIGVWAFVLSIVATTRWQATGIHSKANPGEIWRRFPKFVLGFLIASAIVTVISSGYSYADYKKIVQPSLVAPLQSLRVWAFTFTFLAIGLTTRFREFFSVGAKPFYAFTAGVAVNIVLGYLLSTQVFVGFWTRFGQ